MRSSTSSPAGSERPATPEPGTGKPPLFATDGARIGAIFLGMAAIAFDQEVSYFLVEWTCSASLHWPTFLVSGVALAMALGAAFIGWQDLRRVPAETSQGASPRPGDNTQAGRNRFLSLLGLSLSSFFALAIVLQTVAKLFFGPCQR